MTRIWEYLIECLLEADWELAAMAVSLDGVNAFEAMEWSKDSDG